MALGGAAGVLCGAGVMNAVTALAGAPNFRGTFGAAFGAVDVLVQALPLFVVNVLGSFLLGLLWICTFYVLSDDLSPLPVINDLVQWNLAVGIAFMAVGFTYATRWE